HVRRAHHPPTSAPFPYTTLFRSHRVHRLTGLPFQRSLALADLRRRIAAGQEIEFLYSENSTQPNLLATSLRAGIAPWLEARILRSEEHTSELQSRENLVCRLLLE